MAVKAKVALLNEEDSSRDAAGSSVVTEEEEVEAEQEVKPVEVNVDDEDEDGRLRELHRRVAHSSNSSSYPLSEEVVGVLHKALLALQSHSSKRPHEISPDLLLLLHELQCLKSLIPPTFTQDDEGSPLYVISGALDYVEQLKRKMQSLTEDLQGCFQR